MKDNPKVYFISNRYEGCYYVRCMLPMLHNGWDGAKKFLTSELDSTEVMLQKALNSDIVVFQRPDTPDKTKAIKLLKQAGKKIVFDNDDTYIPDSGFPMLDLPENKKFVKKFNSELYKNIKQADLVTTTTEMLAREYRMMNDNVVVLPNCIDEFDWDEPIRNETDKVRIGLVGSVGYDGYKVIEPLLKDLSKRDNIELVLFGLSKENWSGVINQLYSDTFKFIEENNVEWHAQVPMEKYNDTLNNLALDIMLIPRKETYFNKCKSNIKYLEASMLEIPVIASSFNNGPYEELDGKIGIKCKDKDFKYHTEKLINDKSLRRQIGKNARDYVLKNYNIEDWASKWMTAYKKIYDK